MDFRLRLRPAILQRYLHAVDARVVEPEAASEQARHPRNAAHSVCLDPHCIVVDDHVAE